MKRNSIVSLIAGVTALLCSFSSAQHLTVESPRAGEVYYVGDTISIRFTPDESYLQRMTQTRLMIAIDGVEDPVDICALESDPSWCALEKTMPYYGTISYVIPDSIRALVPGTFTKKNFSMITDSAQIQLVDYAYERNGLLHSSEGRFIIRAASARPAAVVPPAENGCGKGAGVALLVPLLLRPLSRKRRMVTQHN